MDSQAIMLGARVAHVRELKGEIERLRDENTRLRDENAALVAHLDMAMLAVQDLREGGEIELWDGWNLILGEGKIAHHRHELVEQAKATGKNVWIVFDGHDEQVMLDGKVRVSYTGGTGAHRADKFICDFVRMARYLGLADRVTVRTADKDFMRQVTRLKGKRQ